MHSENRQSDGALSDYTSGEDAPGVEREDPIQAAERKLSGIGLGVDTASSSRLLSSRRASLGLVEDANAPLTLLDQNAPMLALPTSSSGSQFSRPLSTMGLFEHPVERHPADRDRGPLDTPREEEEEDLVEASTPANEWVGTYSPLPSFEESQVAHGQRAPFRSPSTSNFSTHSGSSGPFISVASGPLARLAADVRENLHPHLQNTYDILIVRSFTACTSSQQSSLFPVQPFASTYSKLAYGIHTFFANRTSTLQELFSTSFAYLTSLGWKYKFCWRFAFSSIFPFPFSEHGIESRRPRSRHHVKFQSLNTLFTCIRSKCFHVWFSSFRPITTIWINIKFHGSC